MEKIMNFLVGDKMIHFMYSFFLTVFLSSFVDFIYAGLIVFCIGCLKELYDKGIKQTIWNWFDVMFNVWGIVFAMIIVSYLINYV